LKWPAFVQDLGFCTVSEVTSSSSETKSRWIKGHFNKYYIQDLLKIPMESEAMKRILSGNSQPSKLFPDLEDMREYYIEVDLGTLGSVTEGKKIESTTQVEVTAEESHTLERQLRSAGGSSTWEGPNPKAKAKPKASPKALPAPEWLKKWEAQMKKAKACDKAVGNFLLQAGADLVKLSQKPSTPMIKASYAQLEETKKKVAKEEKTYKGKLEAALVEPNNEVESNEQIEAMKQAQKQVEDALKEAKKTSAVVRQLLQ
jgi:arsenate reductase-like glutaredoxin family protein